MTDAKRKEIKEKEVLWFRRKHLGINEENWALFLKHLTPEDVGRILKWVMKAGMTLTWEDEAVESPTRDRSIRPEPEAEVARARGPTEVRHEVGGSNPPASTNQKRRAVL